SDSLGELRACREVVAHRGVVLGEVVVRIQFAVRLGLHLDTDVPGVPEATPLRFDVRDDPTALGLPPLTNGLAALAVPGVRLPRLLPRLRALECREPTIAGDPELLAER